MPVLSIICIILLFFAAVGSTIQYGKPQYDLALLRVIISLVFLAIPPFIAHTRRLAKRNTVYWLSFCWIIPFSWIIALCMAIFGKTDSTDNSDAVLSTERPGKVKKEPVYNKTKFSYATKYNINYQIPDNAIDRTFYKIGHGTINTVKTMRDSRVIRGFFKFIFSISIFLIVVIIVAVLNERLSRSYSVNTYQQPSKNNTYNAIMQESAKRSEQEQRLKTQKSAEQVWFEQAAESMK